MNTKGTWKEGDLRAVKIVYKGKVIYDAEAEERKIKAKAKKLYNEGVDYAWFYLNMEIEKGNIARETAQAIIEEVRTANERRYAK